MPTYSDLYIKFTDKAEADLVLYKTIQEVFIDDEGEEVILVHPDFNNPLYRNIDTIGTIYTGGEWDADGNVITEPVPYEGWHVNVRVVGGEDADALTPYAVTVNTPMRVWG